MGFWDILILVAGVGFALSLGFAMILAIVDDIKENR